MACVPLPSSAFKVKKGLNVLGPALVNGCITSEDLIPISGGTHSIGSSVDFWKDLYVGTDGIDFAGQILDIQSPSEQLGGPSLFFEGEELAFLSSVTALSAGLEIDIDNILTNIANLSAQVIENTENIAFIAGISGNFARRDEENIFQENNTFQKDVSIVGSLTVAGSAFQVDFQNVTTEDNIITVNNNEPGAGVTAISAGMEVDRGTLPDYFFIFVETDDTFRIGLSDSLQRVATRDVTVTEGLIPFGDDDFKFTEDPALKWDNSTKTLEVSGDGNFSGQLTIGPGSDPEHALQKQQIETLVGDISSGLDLEIDNLLSLLIAISGFLQEQITNNEIRITNLEQHHIFSEVEGVSAVPTIVSCVDIAATNKVIWELVAINEDDVTERYSSTVAAIHDGLTGVDFTEYGILNTGGSPDLDVDVTNDGSEMCLLVTGASKWTVQVSADGRVTDGGIKVSGLVNETVTASISGQTTFTYATEIGSTPLVFIDGGFSTDFTVTGPSEITLDAGVEIGSAVAVPTTTEGGFMTETVVAGVSGQTVFDFVGDIPTDPLVFVDGGQTNDFAISGPKQITLDGGTEAGAEVTYSFFTGQVVETEVASGSGQTVFDYDDITTLGSTPLVFIDGVFSTDFTKTDSNTITLDSGVDAGTEVTAVGE